MRVARACREMGLRSVAVYSECDRKALHVRYADEAYPIGPSAPRESYLRIDRLLEAAARSGADAVHPGYGFLAENEQFAAAVRDAGLIFIGPTPEAVALMGSKTAARRAAVLAGVPVVPGTDDPLPGDASDADITRVAAGIGYPLLVKAVSGGGGKGMRTVGAAADILGAVRAARSEAGAAFGDSAVYLERRLTKPRHIEVQLLGDHHGTVIPFVERECSIQRRHQKVVEETPSRVVTPAFLRREMTGAAAAVARGVGYTNAGTIEFLLDADGKFYFLEMNTRLQVEHPVTEMVTGIDLVRWQIRIAQGERLDIDPERALTPVGHAIECRIYAEDPDNNFLPSPGRIHQLRAPGGPGVRDDGGATAGLDVPIFYDPLISKLIAWAEDRLVGRRGAHAPARSSGIRRHRHQDDAVRSFRMALRAGRVPVGRLSHDISGRRARGPQWPALRGADGAGRRDRGDRGRAAGGAHADRSRRGRSRRDAGGRCPRAAVEGQSACRRPQCRAAARAVLTCSTRSRSAAASAR